MRLSENQLSKLAELAKKAAIDAGQLISRAHNTSLLVKDKHAGSSKASQVVTEVDLQSQNIIEGILKDSCSKYDLGWLAEESPDDNSRFTKDYFWCVDPLDGTLPFIEGTDGYAVSIALVSKQGIPQIGVVLNPVNGRLYSTVKGGGVYINGVEETHSNNKTDVFTIIADRSTQKHPQYKQYISAMKELLVTTGFNCKVIDAHGGAVMNAIGCLENAPACYVKFPKKETGGGAIWDYAATACFFNELPGAFVSEASGSPLDLNNANTLFMNHCGVLYIVDNVIKHELINLVANCLIR